MLYATKKTLVAIVFLNLFCAAGFAQGRKTIWSGIYTDAQAARGERAFIGACARCHLEDLSGRNGPALKGDDFFEKWRESNLGILFSTVKNMPPTSQRNPTARLPESASLDILTHLLKLNGAAAGDAELTIDALPAIQFEKRTGPEAIPNLTLVWLAGCLAQPSPTTWSVASASAPIRAMDQEVFSAAEISAAKIAAPGADTHRLSQIDYNDKPIANFRDQQVLIKGNFIRSDNGTTRINMTALEPLGRACSQ